MEISSSQAFDALNKAMAKAREINIPANIVILDPGGHIKAFIRMDDAYLGSIDIAFGKAKTAMLFRMESQDVGEFLKPEAKAYGITNTSGGLVGFKGGVPLRADDTIIAYIGVSGGTPDQDYSIAIAGSNL